MKTIEQLHKINERIENAMYVRELIIKRESENDTRQRKYLAEVKKIASELDLVVDFKPCGIFKVEKSEYVLDKMHAMVDAMIDALENIYENAYFTNDSFFKNPKITKK